MATNNADSVEWQCDGMSGYHPVDAGVPSRSCCAALCLPQVPAVVALLQQGSSAGSGGSGGDAAGAEAGAEAGPDAATCINMMATLTAAAQGGEEGAQSVVNAGGGWRGGGRCTNTAICHSQRY